MLKLTTLSLASAILFQGVAFADEATNQSPVVDKVSLNAFYQTVDRVFDSDIAAGGFPVLVDINAYHQPGVEAGKKAAAIALEMSTALRGLIAEDGQTVDALSKALNAPSLDVYFLLQRLQATGRVRQDRTGREVLWRCT